MRPDSTGFATTATASSGAVAHRQRSIAVLCDSSDAIRGAIAEQICEGGHFASQVHRVQILDRHRADPYGLADRIPALDLDAAVLVAPRRRGARGLLPGPVVGGVPVGIIQADRADHLPVTGPPSDPDAEWVVAAMAKNVFLEASSPWASQLREVHPAVDLRADRARRSDLINGIHAGPGVVLYAGHGSPRGWAGYQAVRIEHFTDSVPRQHSVGLAVAFACRTLGRQRGRWPFGSQLVEAGIVRSYLAPSTAVFTADAERLAEILIELLVDHRPGDTVADLMVDVERRVVDDAAARRAWATFRLIGDPLTPIV